MIECLVITTVQLDVNIDSACSVNRGSVGA